MLDEKVGKHIQHQKCAQKKGKCWMKCLMAIKISSNIIFTHPTRFFLLFQILRSAKPIQHFIQHGNFLMLDEMLDWFASALTKELNKILEPPKNFGADQNIGTPKLTSGQRP